MPIPNKQLAALAEAVDTVSSLIDENEALIGEVARLRADLKASRATEEGTAKAYAFLSQRMHRWLLVPGIVEALAAHGESDDL